ncbi:MAG: hypothetical protein ACFFD1_08915 [Candidatus Thorarchaeota archaeon]
MEDLDLFIVADSLVVENNSKIQFPYPIIQTFFDTCKICKFCCQWCKFITPDGCGAPNEYELLSLCRSFPILIGNGYGFSPSLGLEDEQYPKEFGAFVPIGNHCMSLQDERQRLVFQQAARYINEGFREFVIYTEEEDYYVLIIVKDSKHI